DDQFCTLDQARRLGSDILGSEPLRVVEGELDPELLRLIPAELAYRHSLLPVAKDGETTVVAMADPLDLDAIDDVRVVTGLAVEPLAAEADDLRRAVESYYMRSIMSGDGEGEGVEVIEETEEEIGDLARMAREALVVKAVNMIIRQAVQARASDIHIEPMEKELRIRYRIDGVLTTAPPPPKRLQAAIISRVKIMANLDIAERRLPQDGRIPLRVAGKDIDLRVSTVPTLYGEAIVMRILDKSSVMYGLHELGFQDSDLVRFESLIHRPHGIVLATGPTGSGKTTTLYAALQATFSDDLKVITIEDPVEYQLDGVNQIEVKSRIGLSFARGLRHIVRQDPDIIMVGEIRDAETADIAVHSALTGHLVFSSLHTNDAAGAVTRLVDLEVEPFLVVSTLSGAVGQRLVRTICSSCKEETKVDFSDYRFLGNLEPLFPDRKAWQGHGCDDCRGTGYRGRTGLYEVLAMSEEIEKLILASGSSSEVRQVALRDGMTTMKQDGLSKVQQGITTLEEVQRAARDVYADAPAEVE
ncbi:MAG: type II secretion system protein GspE, partial [Armatimonadia bacterium]|nr:type II secretion system protein GspE [Armatimonadia bacterium]